MRKKEEQIFLEETKDKPINLKFKIRGENKIYSNLQELSKNLVGLIKRNSLKVIMIDWEWLYESGESVNLIEKNDFIDTKDGSNIEKYKFKIIVDGEEVV